MDRQAIYTSKPVDRRYEYAPAVMCARSGLVFISGMVGWDAEGRIPEPADPSAQARRAFQNLSDTLAEAGAGLRDVVMATEYVVDMSHYREIASVRREFFGTARPAATLVEVRRLFKPELLFEIQAIALLPGGIGQDARVQEGNLDTDNGAGRHGQ